MVKDRFYCQSSGCGREIGGVNAKHLNGGVVVANRLYCCFEHGGIENNSVEFYDLKAVKKAVRNGTLKEFGQLEKSTSEQ
jgi:hypothetical protein